MGINDLMGRWLRRKPKAVIYAGQKNQKLVLLSLKKVVFSGYQGSTFQNILDHRKLSCLGAFLSL